MNSTLATLRTSPSLRYGTFYLLFPGHHSSSFVSLEFILLRLSFGFLSAECTAATTVTVMQGIAQTLLGLSHSTNSHRSSNLSLSTRLHRLSSKVLARNRALVCHKSIVYEEILSVVPGSFWKERMRSREHVGTVWVRVRECLWMSREEEGRLGFGIGRVRGRNQLVTQNLSRSFSF